MAGLVKELPGMRVKIDKSIASHYYQIKDKRGIL